ncbi:hypothetical protein Nepgr_022477 [Nepenthes gracilis]|uniref:NB-ARC domain-containing protein n=1 Tax=Nepenthes gracilis TaxID=150966 RepID=A0AAD3T0X3_NEPGR|nr:hypothetical protein Nepgr_022477 [Nepenthes gracilis]
MISRRRFWIIQPLRPSSSDFQPFERHKNSDLLQKNLRDREARKKILIILDDVWNENLNCWDALLFPLGSAARGSSIIATTRNSSVAAVINSTYTLNLRPLPDDGFWSILKALACGDEQPTSDPRLQAMGSQIASKCRGLPLVARALGGGLLRTKSDVDECFAISSSCIWDFPHERGSILPVL